MNEELLNRIQDSIDAIPTLPGIVPRLLAILDDDESSVAEVADLIGHDPPLTSRVLRVANSAYYGFSGQVASLQKAVLLIGLRMVKSIALSIPVVQCLSGRGAAVISHEGLWVHSIAVATLIQGFSRILGWRSREYLFAVGILHDVGEIVLSSYFEKEYRQALHLIEKGEEELLYQAEARVIGIDHSVLAAHVLKRWKFPDLVIEPISHHHLETYPESGGEDTAVLRVANHLSHQVGLGGIGNLKPAPLLEQDLAVLGIDGADIDEACDYCEERREAIRDFFAAVA